MKLDYANLLLVLIPVVFLYGLLVYKMRDKQEKVYVSLIFWGLYFYGGIGASSTLVSASYTIYYLIFTAVFVFFYRLRYMLPHIFKNTIARFYQKGGGTLFDTSFSNSLIIYSYLLFCLCSLLYPKLLIVNLIHPPAPDIVAALLGTIDNSTENIDILSKIIFYFKLLLLPLYLLSLFRYTKRPWPLFLLLFIPIYIDYCASSYIGRGIILIYLALWLLTVYTFNKKIRRPLLIACFILIPLMLTFFAVYSVARLGNGGEVSFTGNMIEDLFYQEVNFAESFNDVVTSGKHIDFGGFVIWIITLPFPKFIIGGINVPIINFELSEIVLGTSRNDEGFWVKLTGYISESYYIFGKAFFWVEAVMVAWLSKAIFHFLRNIKGSQIVIYFVAIQFGFMFSRAGLGAVMPTLINGFLALYAYFTIKVYFQKRINISS